MSQRIFVDTSAYYALTDPHDNNHAAASSMALRLAGEGADLFTTNFVAAETHGLILNRMDRNTAERVLERLYASTTRIVRAKEGDEAHAREIVRQYQDKEFSLVDAISFAVMERLHLRLAWSYDQHFSQIGFALLR